MMFGTRDEFDYFECASCGCLQIAEIPPNISDYYPSNYYSFHKPKPGSLEKWIKKEVAMARLAGKDMAIGTMLRSLYPGHLRWMTPQTRINFESSILDVGSGVGNLIMEMREYGFQHLTGVDPFIAQDIDNNGVKVLKRNLQDVEGQYDLVMLHHSFEHMANPAEVFDKLSGLVQQDGRILIRIPVADCQAWEKYGINWVELDPPRHFFLHTKKSIDILAQGAGLQVEAVIYDSSNFEIIGSEKWSRDIPSNSPEDPFTSEEKKAFTKEVEVLNETGRACRACFYLSVKNGAA